MARTYTFAPGEFYHVYNRGTDRRQIFSDRRDYERFLSLLYMCNGLMPVHLQRQGRTLTEVCETERGEPLVSIGAYCLMPNHFHLLVQELSESGISRFMKKIGNAYTGYFNILNDRSGALFQGSYKASHVGGDTYLKYLISYIHLNPVKLVDPLWKENGIAQKDEARRYIEAYPYSSYMDYLGIERPENSILDIECLPEYFTTKVDFEKTIDDWLSYEKPKTLRQG